MQNGAGHSCRYYLKMDDDDFGGFEAAETFECGSGETHTTSPAIPWAAFPTVSGVHIPPPVSPESLLEQSSSSAHLISSKPIISSQDSTLIVPQTTNNIVQPSTKTIDHSVFPLHLTDEKTHEIISVVDDSAEDHQAIELNIELRQKVASLKVKLKASEEEKQRIKKELETLLEKHRVLEKGILKEKEDEVIFLQDKYKILQEQHKRQLEDMKKAGHETLSIITEEYKALLQTTVKQQEESIGKQYVSAIEKQARKCEELLNAQHQRLLDMLDVEKEQLTEKIKEALTRQSQDQKELLGKYLTEEMQRNKDALATAAKETLRAAMAEERKQSERAVEEAVKRTKEELMEYVKEQKRLDQVIRQRNLSTLELFLSCAQKQLNSLISEEPASTEEEQEKLTSTDRD
ncbi:coiled-coil domain-containing protein 91 isoform X4 [Antechinus flavipes]|uniref:coiled-coil domain-containing protein 91 isoform X4 n=1 Tax=Antechinus flavipes TaxID=38775 RepID=UPI0022369569|nr:coiled-coil domain-containing protein 91 isoform X4 [Antechinus flavipes]